VAAVFKMPGAQITEAFAGTLLAATEEDYNAFIAYAKEHSLYDTGVTPQWPEQLLTLGTCEYTYEDGRLFVVGRAVPALK
jgi:sortase B